jgi:formylmethanofuran dehydrogenase subunit D
MAGRRFLLNAGRTTKQGQQVNVGKDYPEYQAIVSTLAMHPEDMRAVGVAPGGKVRVRTPHGEATFQCSEGKVPLGMIFVPYGPPTCRLMGGGTDGTGMPTSKGWEVEVHVTLPPIVMHRSAARSGMLPALACILVLIGSFALRAVVVLSPQL